jgi:hypothetical protein
MATRDSVHALVDDLPEGDLPRAKRALEDILGFDVTDEERKELLDREAECDRGEVVEAHPFLEDLRRKSA